MKSQALSSQYNPQQIIASSQINPFISGALPELSNLKHTLRRVCQRNNCAPPNPPSLFNFEIPEKYTLIKNGRRFLQYDSGSSDDRILIFFTKENLELMIKCNNWFVDGTFKSSPILFTQIYTIHVLTAHLLTSTVYALLPNKSQNTYVSLLNQLKKIKPTLLPKSIMSDFEMGSINAFKEVFPNLKTKRMPFPFLPMHLA
jgi:hypothetical protein|uniref:MULE transposase domain-containing protein n=1 Tax=Sipha flava TaxID=143950 RepID=A0A2S2Q556_9HEMI